MSEWKKVKLGELCDFINGGAWSDKEYVPEGIPVLKVTNCKNSGFSLSELSYLPYSLEQKYIQNKLQRYDVIIATVGSHPNLVNSSAGRSVIVNSFVEGFYLNQNAVCIRTTNESVLNQLFWGYYSKYYLFQHYIQMRGKGAANQMRIAISAIKEYQMPLPPINVQRHIAAILSRYDSLIENYQKQIKLLEEAAQRLYKEWFVDLHFPGHENTKIVDGVPEGWEMKKLIEFGCSLESGSRPKGGVDSNLKDGIPSVGAENVIGLGKYNYSSEKLITNHFYSQMRKGKIKDRDILIYKDGAYIGRTSLFQDGFPHKEMAVNEHVFLLHTLNENYQYYVFFTLYQKQYFEKMQKLNKNAAQPGLNQKALLDLGMLRPSENYVLAFSKAIEPLMKALFSKSNQIRLLTEARDRLLPKLMSGEIAV